MYTELDQAALKQLAIDIRAGQVFTDRHCRDVDELTSSFMVLLFLEDEKTIQAIKNAGLVYEYLSEAGPRAINGRPMFFSCRVLSKEDASTVWEIVKKLEEAEKAV